MELNGVQLARLGRHRGNGTCLGFRKRIEPLRGRAHSIEVTHPDLLWSVYSREQTSWTRNIEHRESIFAVVAFDHVAAKKPGHQLVSVADAEHRRSGFEDFRIDSRASRGAHARRASRNDDPFSTGEFCNGSFARRDIRVHPEVTPAARDPMTVLSSGTADGDLRGQVLSYKPAVDGGLLLFQQLPLFREIALPAGCLALCLPGAPAIVVGIHVLRIQADRFVEVRDRPGVI